jgi:hypothetical protein
MATWEKASAFRAMCGMTTTKSTARTLTVSSLHREWGQPHRKNECVVPSIRLNGKWLASLGFVSGQQIRVITNGAIITLAPVSFDSELRHYGK